MAGIQTVTTQPHYSTGRTTSLEEERKRCRPNFGMKSVRLKPGSVSKHCPVIGNVVSWGNGSQRDTPSRYTGWEVNAQVSYS